MLHLDNLICQILEVPFKIHSDGEDDIDFVGAGLDGQGHIGDLDREEGLGGGETAGDDCDIDSGNVKGRLDNFGKVGVDADGGYIPELGLSIVKVIDAFCKGCHALDVVKGAERGQVYG